MKYVANDGMEFHNFEECRQYETDPSFEMYGDNGRTDLVKEAKVVRIIRPEGAKYFKILNDKFDYNGDGVLPYPGWYYWNENRQEYCEVEEDVIAILKREA